MAAVDVLRARGDDASTAHIACLLGDMRIGLPMEPLARTRLAFVATPAHPQLGPHGGHFSQSPAPSAPAPSAPPTARAQAPASTPFREPSHSAWPGQRGARALAHPPLLGAPTAQPPVRPPSPDSRYLTTNWAAHDEVEEELAFMMSEQAAIRDEAPRHELSYIS